MHETTASSVIIISRSTSTSTRTDYVRRLRLQKVPVGDAQQKRRPVLGPMRDSIKTIRSRFTAGGVAGREKVDSWRSVDD